ncbi:hypothetical protein [uncultured Serinicoccus sp.]|uniref:hypothetical protein n=1 Tax=uncultured Serinicoccus sp. TaxID=735514 RepID=UPI0026100C3D|nr:hypothetical protein [uncultured Serinicoccus sp.]
MRRTLAGLWAILPLAALLLALTVVPPPDRVPTHWSGRAPDGFASGPGFVAGVLATVVVCTVLAAVASVARRLVPPSWGRWVLTALAAVSWGAVLLYVVTAWRVGVDGPEGVREGWPLLAVLGALLAGLVGYAVHGRWVPSAQELADLVPERSRVQPVRGRAVEPVHPWASDVSSRTLTVLAVGLLVLFALVAVVLVVAGEGVVLLAVVLVTGLGAGGLALLWSAVTVEVDEDGLRVRSRVLPVPVARVRAEQVAGADVQDLDPMHWGGIGLRALPDRTAYIVDRGGPGIVVYLRTGRRLALRITEGDQAARVGARTLLRAAGQRVGAGSAS